ncbi:conserved hypothetical protein [Desulfamplus magnetovallimortis]|uniref:Putative restriction endonuclease domain-containing protein n=1 Tax=Desulfamplus magnetovallimortis TaxID=1246637 RepID=A0A1W1HE50_9BACT|nr:Uma2 family endonuclease [Desulfamplus magnetovallimortis]SLM30713.1 conserved hypothetical protein [Desulfamplus magnetovallimortis]
MAQPSSKIISPEEYFYSEETSDVKNEYFHGEIFAMTGASLAHNIIASNTIIELGMALQGSECTVFTSDMKVEIDPAHHYTYPDISVVCGGIKLIPNRNDVITNPVVIIEILSQSTMDYDRGSKFTAYRNIDTLRDYILINQYKYHVEYFSKNDSNAKWHLNEYKQKEDTINIQSIDTRLTLKQIYNKI